jgi:hypothetical protein
VLERKEDGRVQECNAGHAPHGQPAGSVQAEEGSGGLSRACVARDQDDVGVCVCTRVAVAALVKRAWHLEWRTGTHIVQFVDQCGAEAEDGLGLLDDIDTLVGRQEGAGVCLGQVLLERFLDVGAVVGTSKMPEGESALLELGLVCVVNGSAGCLGPESCVGGEELCTNPAPTTEDCHVETPRIRDEDPGFLANCTPNVCAEGSNRISGVGGQADLEVSWAQAEEEAEVCLEAGRAGQAVWTEGAQECGERRRGSGGARRVGEGVLGVVGVDEEVGEEGRGGSVIVWVDEVGPGALEGQVDVGKVQQACCVEGSIVGVGRQAEGQARGDEAVEGGMEGAEGWSEWVVGVR